MEVMLMKEKGEFSEYAKSSLIRISKFAHILLNVLLQAVCLYYYNTEHNNNDVGSRRFMLFVALYTAVLCFSLRTYRAYSFGMSRVTMLVYSQSLSVLIADAVFYIVFVIANSTVFTPLPLFVLLIVQFLGNIACTVLINKLYFRLNKPRKATVFYNGQAELSRLRDIAERKKNFELSGVYKVGEDSFEDIFPKLAGSEVVLVAGLSSELRNTILQYCLESGKQCYALPCTGDIIMMGAKHMDMFSVPVFSVSRATLKIEYAVVKRALDIMCSLVGIIVLSPVMLIVALAIALYDRGPVLYRQTRLTQGGREFEILKFRSMRVDAENDGVARLATDHDDRITPVGKVIRACRLDELPQLFNILKGDMTLVGPRPERPEIAEQYEQVLPEFNLRLQVKAGLTGFAQVYGRYNTEPRDKLQMDLMYINRMSLAQDLKLLFATVKILFLRESTHGTAEGQTTAMTDNKDTTTV